MEASSRRRLVLHIGTMKTGSTTLQHWISHNRKALAAAGVGTPASFGNNHSPLALCFDDQPDALPKENARLLLHRLSEELRNLPPSIKAFVLSGEILSHRLNTPVLITRLREFFAPYFDDFQIVAYLRRQDEQGVSMYSTALKRGDDVPLLWGPMDYRRFLSAWKDVFGRDSMRVRIFDKESLLNGDIVSDFLHATQLPGDPQRRPSGNRNPSLKPSAQQLLVLVREKLGPSKKIADLPLQEALVEYLQVHAGGQGMLPSRSQVERYYAPCREWNESLRAEWFPERKLLFAEDFSKYPIEPTPMPTDSRVLDVAIGAIAALLQTGKG